MRVFAIGDMHLAGGAGKTMDRFGDHWIDHDLRIFSAWDAIGSHDDLLIVAGDTSWAMRLEDALPDLARVGAMKGRKLLLKGNHDYWWQSESKLRRTIDPSIVPLNARSLIVNRIAIAGARGWVCPDDRFFTAPDRKVYEREVGRLRRALEPLSGMRDQYDSLIVALHYPPVNSKHESSGFTELIDEFRADFCLYGHLHGEDIAGALTGKREATRYHLVSADAVGFAPALVLQTLD